MATRVVKKQLVQDQKKYWCCPIRLAEKLWLKELFADLLWEKNTVRWLKKYGL
jgi:hypothetical protein